MKKGLSLLTAAVILAMTPAAALAAAPTGPGAQPEPEKYTAEELARLEDNVLEYDEIQLRVREYNPTISEMWKTYEDTKQDYAAMVTELESQARIVEDLADSYISAGQLMGSSVLISSGRELNKGYRDLVQGMRDTVNEWDTKRTNTALMRQYERQMTAGAQQAMIGYDTMRRNIATLETMVDLYQKQCEMYERMQALGMATDKDVLSAKTSPLTGQSQLASLNSQMEGVRRSLCLLLGYDPDSDVEIRPVPAFDMSRLDGMDLEEDTRKAIGNNYTLISQRTSAAGKTTAQIEQRKKTIQEGDQKLTIEMQRLYQDVMDKKAAYDAASVGYEAAETSFQASTRQYEQGLLSGVQYIGAQLSYYQKKAAWEAADLALLQSMENYDWGVMGFAAVE
ncbi:MAG TPA: TolC family protein [Candidatus Ventrimonas merdavium]|nr:TolC family protein [Candidatus Ventrimonas merdavium]